MGLQGKDIAEYATKHQTFDGEEKAAWTNRPTQKMQAQADIKLAKIQAEADVQKIQADAEEQKRAGEIRMEEIKNLTLKRWN